MLEQSPFEPVLAKVAEILVTAERESEHLFQERTKVQLVAMSCGWKCAKSTADVYIWTCSNHSPICWRPSMSGWSHAERSLTASMTATC